MIDHLRRYDNEAEALADPLVSAYRTPDGWDTSRVIPGCRVYTGEDEARTYLPYWYLWIAERQVIDALRGACIIIADREKALAGVPFIIESLMPAEALALYQIEPIMAGSAYPFGPSP